jgi:hypothetical protein
MRSCAYTGCPVTFTSPVLTPDGTMNVCARHHALLEAEGKVLDRPPSLVAITVEDTAERARRAKIQKGIEAARAAGAHVGRPPTPVPAAAVEEVRAGEPLRVVARRHGVDRNTLQRRAEGTVTVAAPPSKEHPAALPVLVEDRACLVRRAARAALRADEDSEADALFYAREIAQIDARVTALRRIVAQVGPT